MFSKQNRLTKKKDFDNVFKKGRSSFDKIIGIKIVQNDFDFCRIGIMVSVKVDKRAVIRNKIKRQIRNITQKFLPDIKNGHDIVIIAQPFIAEKDFSEIEKSINKHFKKLKLI